MTILTYLFISLGINLVLFFPAFKTGTDKLTDIAYSISFAVIALSLLVQNGFSSYNIIVAGMILLWSLRLGTFLWIRINQMKKDKRFDGIRDNLWSFLKFWLLQAFTAWFISLPAIFGIEGELQSLSFFGVTIWFAGLIIESVADFQKLKFRNTDQYPKHFIQTGLWAYSRHPNYLGEIMIWLGITISVIPGLSIIQLCIAVATLIFISYMLIVFTGIPPLEKYADQKWGDLEEYKHYKAKTAKLIPKIW